MSLDTRFSMAIHFLIVISESKQPKSSADLARSIGTNPSHVRKLASSLKRAGLIESRKGVAGFQMVQPADKITFLDIARAAMDNDAIHMFEVHKNPNDRCLVGHYIQPVLTDVFSCLDEAAMNLLKEKTLQDCINDMRRTIAEDGNLAMIETGIFDTEACESILPQTN